MSERFSRSEMLIGEKAQNTLSKASVAVFGVGGVGGFLTESLARAGVGRLLLVDNDTVSVSNINRQIIALEDTVGRHKTEVMRERIRQINPECCVEVANRFVLEDNIGEFSVEDYNYVADAVDTVSAKLAIIRSSLAAGVPVISAMGAGNKLDPTALKLADISETSGCPLARVMRHELRAAGIVSGVPVVYSPEMPLKPLSQPDAEHTRKSTPGSISYMPAVAGMLMSYRIISDLVGR